jgi:DNA polymerase I-like protein with 3'-5' exonuclease and polymerase domains
LNTIYAADLESTGLLHHLVEQGKDAKMHNFCAMGVTGNKMHLFDTNSEKQVDTIRRFLDRDITLVMHNGICYDKNALKFFNFDTSKVNFVDTLSLSYYLDLYRPKHGLESYGEEFGVPKPVIEDWQILEQNDYNHRVKEDVKIQLRTYEKLKFRFEQLYGTMTDEDFCNHKVVKMLNFKMSQLEEQQNVKFKIDVKKTQALIDDITVKLEAKILQLKSVMPKVPKIKKNKPPAKPHKMDGELSVTGKKWLNLTKEHNLPFEHDEEILTVAKYEEPNPQSPQQIKAWLDGLGWIPTTFKYDKEDDGTERVIPQIYIPQSGGQICPSIEELSFEVPDVMQLTGMGVLKHRCGVLQGFLDSLVFGEYIEASSSAFTNTLRMKHRKPAVNLPSSRVELGTEVRSCMIARKGKVLCGSDLSSLENTIKFNLQLPYDRDYVMSQMSDDFDPHLDIAIEAGLVNYDEVNFYKISKEGFPESNYEITDKLRDMLDLTDDEIKVEIKRIGKARSSGKATNYSCQYGAGGATVARAAGVSLRVGEKLVKAYRKLNWTIDVIAAQMNTKRTSFGVYQFNPFNNMWYNLKTKKDAFSTLVQGTGAYVFDLWLSQIFKLRDSGEYKLGKDGALLLAQFHDEFILEVDEDCQDECRRLISDALDNVNRIMKLEIPFGCDIQFGKDYSEIH